MQPLVDGLEKEPYFWRTLTDNLPIPREASGNSEFLLESGSPYTGFVLTDPGAGSRFGKDFILGQWP